MPFYNKTITSVNSYITKKLLQEFGFSSTKQAKNELQTKRISQALDILKNQHNYNIYVKTLVSIEKNKKCYSHVEGIHSSVCQCCQIT